MRRDRTHIRESTKTHEGRDKTHRPAYLLLTPACVFFLQRPQRFTLCGLIHRIIKCPGFLHVSSTKRGHPVILCVSITIRDGEGNKKVQECLFKHDFCHFDAACSSNCPALTAIVSCFIRIWDGRDGRRLQEAARVSEAFASSESNQMFRNSLFGDDKVDSRCNSNDS